MTIPALDLLLRVQQRDEAALSTLYDDFSAALYGVVLRILNGSEELAQEVLQDTFLKVWNNAASYDTAKGRPFTWMMNIARNSAIDKLRSAEVKKGNAIRSMDDHVFHLAADAAPDTLANAEVTRVVEGLKAEHRQLIDMAYYLGYSQQEISEHTGLPLGTVKSRTRAAMNELRVLLKDHR